MSGKRSDRTAFFIDLDGTLADSVGVLRAAYVSFLKSCGRQPIAGEFDRLNGPTTLQVADALRVSHKLPMTRKEVRRAYIAHVAQCYLKTVRPAPDAERLLRLLSRRKHPLHLVTSSLPEIAGAWVRLQGWSRFFKTQTFGSEVRRGKPDPEIYRLAFRKAGGDPRQERVVIEDSKSGCAAAKRAGACVLAVGPKASDDTRPYADLAFGGLKGVLHWVRSDAWRRAIVLAYAGPVSARLQGKRPRVVRDRILCLKRRTEPGVFCGTFKPYWDFIAAMRAGRPHPSALAVCGITTVGQGERMKFLVGERSAEVAIYPHCWETVPAGGIDPDAAKPDGTVDLDAMILKEFAEETGLDRSRVRSTAAFGAVRDRGCNAYDLAIHVSLKPGSEKARLDFPKKEYTRMRWLSRRQILSFARGGRKVVPTFTPLLRAFELYERKETTR